MIARRIAVAVVTATLSLGIVAVTSPAQAADTTWGHGFSAGNNVKGGVQLKGIE